MKNKEAFDFKIEQTDNNRYDIYCAYLNEDSYLGLPYEKICSISGYKMQFLKNSIDFHITHMVENLHPDLRIIVDCFSMYSFDGFPSLHEIGIATNGNDFIVLDNKFLKYPIGEKLSNNDILEIIDTYLITINKHLENSPDSYNSIYRKAYFEAWKVFLKKGVGPFIKKEGQK